MLLEEEKNEVGSVTTETLKQIGTISDNQIDNRAMFIQPKMMSTVPAGIRQEDGGITTHPNSQQTSMEKVAERRIETDREAT